MTKQANQCIEDRIRADIGGICSPAALRIPFAQKLSRDEAGAIAHDFAGYVHECTGQNHIVVDETDHFGVKYSLVPEEGGNPNYTMMSSLAPGVKGAKGMVYIKRSLVCRHPLEALMEYSPNGTIEALVETKQGHDRMQNRSLWAVNAAVGVAEIAGFWGAAIPILRAAGEYNAWLALPVAYAWMFVLMDSVYRCAFNLSLRKASLLDKREIIQRKSSKK